MAPPVQAIEEGTQQRDTSAPAVIPITSGRKTRPALNWRQMPQCWQRNPADPGRPTTDTLQLSGSGHATHHGAV